MSRFKHVPSFKQFMLSREVKGLYRAMFREICKIEDKDYQQFFRESVRNGFKPNMKETNEREIKVLVSHGLAQLSAFQKTRSMASR